MEKYSPRQIRIMFLMHTWYSVLDFKQETLVQAEQLETTFKVFFLPSLFSLLHQPQLSTKSERVKKPKNIKIFIQNLS